MTGRNMRDDKRLHLTEHLAELRRRLIIILVAVIIGMGIAWNYSGDILDFIEQPLSGATYLTAIKQRLNTELRSRAPEIYNRYAPAREAPLSERNRRLNYSAPLEPFFIQCKISMLAGFILVLPVVFQQIWAFVAPGLTIAERRFVIPFVIAATVTFCAGALFFVMVIWPVIINFSLSYETQGLQSWFNLSAYVNFCLRLVLIFGLIFELPVLTLMLARLGIVSHGLLASRRKYALLASSIIAAFHADLITMLVIMIPLYLMYEISVWVALVFGVKDAPSPKPAPVISS